MLFLILGAIVGLLIMLKMWENDPPKENEKMLATIVVGFIAGVGAAIGMVVAALVGLGLPQQLTKVEEFELQPPTLVQSDGFGEQNLNYVFKRKPELGKATKFEYTRIDHAEVIEDGDRSVGTAERYRWKLEWTFKNVWWLFGGDWFNNDYYKFYVPKGSVHKNMTLK